MSATVEMIVGSLRASHQALRGSVIDLTPEEYLQRPAEGAECAGWALGHAVFADHEALRELAAFPPDLKCVSDDFAARFAVRDDNGSVWPAEVDDLLPSFTAYRMAIIRAAAGLTPGSIDRPVHGVILPNNEPAIPYTTTGTMLLALSAYTSMLVGELSVIRTGLGRPPSSTGSADGLDSCWDDDQCRGGPAARRIRPRGPRRGREAGLREVPLRRLCRISEGNRG